MALSGITSDLTMMSAVILDGTYKNSTALVLKETGSTRKGGVTNGVVLDIDFNKGTASVLDLRVEVSDDGGTTYWEDLDETVSASAADKDVVAVVETLPHETHVRAKARDTGATPTGNTLTVKGRLRDATRVTR
jgi:hypothetical protein